MLYVKRLLFLNSVCLEWFGWVDNYSFYKVFDILVGVILVVLSVDKKLSWGCVKLGLKRDIYLIW